MPTGVYKRTKKHREIARNAALKKYKEDPDLRKKISIATKKGMIEKGYTTEVISELTKKAMSRQEVKEKLKNRIMTDELKEKISNEVIICRNCKKPFMALKSIGIDDFPIIDDQPCPYCLISKSGKKFDKNGKEIN